MGCGSSVQIGFQTLPRLAAEASQPLLEPRAHSILVRSRAVGASFSSTASSVASTSKVDQLPTKPVSAWRESDVRSWLVSLGLGEKVENLKGINGKAILTMTEAEFEALEGLNWPDRALLQGAVASLHARQAEEQGGAAKTPLGKLLLAETDTLGSKLMSKTFFARRRNSQPSDPAGAVAAAAAAATGGGEEEPDPAAQTAATEAAPTPAPSMRLVDPASNDSASPASSPRSGRGVRQLSIQVLDTSMADTRPGPLGGLGDLHISEVSDEGIQINSWMGDQLVGDMGDAWAESSPDILWAEPASTVLLGRRLSPVPESPTVSMSGSLDSPGSASGVGSIPSSPSFGSPGCRKPRRAIWDLNDGSMLQEQADKALSSIRRLTAADNELIIIFAKATGQSCDVARANVQQLLQNTDTAPGVAGDLQIAALLDDTAKLLFSKGHFSDAANQYRSALGVRLRHQGRRNREVVGTLRGLADSLHRCGKREEAEELYREAQRSLKRLVGSDHTEVGAVATRLGALLAKATRPEKLAEAEQLVRGALAISRRHNGAYHPTTVEGLVVLADVLAAQQRYGDAETLYRQGNALVLSSYGPMHIARATALEGLAKILCRRAGVERNPASFAAQAHVKPAPQHGSEELLNEAAEIMEEALEVRKELQGSEHPDTGLSLYALAGLLHAVRRLPEACSCFDAALEVLLPIYGISHELTGYCKMGLGDCFTDLRQYEDAALNYRTALSCFESHQTGHAEELSSLLSRLAMVADFQGEHAEAESLIRRNLAFCKEAYGDNHPNVAACWFSLATVLQNCEEHVPLTERQRLAEAEAALRTAIRVWEAAAGTGLSMAMALNNLASLLDRSGRYKDAEPLLRQSLDIVRSLDGDVATAQSNLALLLQSTGHFHEAEMLHLSALEEREKPGSHASQAEIADSLANLAALLRCVGDKPHEAEAYLRRCIKIRQKALGGQHPETAEVMRELAALLDQQLNQTEEAELLYNSAATTLARALGTEHPAYVRVQQLLGELYARTGRLPEAEACLRTGLLAAEGVLRPSEELPVASLLLNLAGVLAQREQYAEAELLLLRALHVRKQQASQLPGIVECLAALGRLYLGWGRHSDAHASHLQALAAAERLGPHHCATRQLLEEMDGLRSAAPDYLGHGELESKLSAMARDTVARGAEAEPPVKPIGGRTAGGALGSTLSLGHANYRGNSTAGTAATGGGAEPAAQRSVESQAYVRFAARRESGGSSESAPGGPSSHRWRGSALLEDWAADGWGNLVHAPSAAGIDFQDARRPVSAVLTHQTLQDVSDVFRRASDAYEGAARPRARPRSTPIVQLSRTPSQPSRSTDSGGGGGSNVMHPQTMVEAVTPGMLLVQ